MSRGMASWVARLQPGQGGCSYGAKGIRLGIALTRDADRPMHLELSPADARLLAASLSKWADRVEDDLRPKWEAYVNKVDVEYFPDVWAGEDWAAAPAERH